MDGKHVTAADVKQVIVVRRDLGMRRGKEIAQGAHASTAWIVSRLAGRTLILRSDATWQATGYFTETERLWMYGGSRKVCCTVSSEQALIELAQQAHAAGITCELIQDAGKTEFGGTPTWTAVALGPDTDEKLDPLTGDLALY